MTDEGLVAPQKELQSESPHWRSHLALVTAVTLDNWSFESPQTLLFTLSINQLVLLEDEILHSSF